MFKKLLLSLMCLSFIVCGIPSSIKANESVVTQEYVEEWKNTIGKNAYFIYTPQSEQDLLNLGENDVIAVFEGVKVTKQLLNENLELDIDKITAEDFVIDETSLNSEMITEQMNSNPTITPYAAVLPDIGGGPYNGTYTVPSYANGVIVSRTNSFSDGTNSAEIIHYLNNADFKMFKDKLSSGQSWKSTWEAIMGVLLITVPAYISVMMAFITVPGVFVEEAFQNKINALYNSGSNVKVKITVSGVYKSVVEWTDNKFYARNDSLNGSVFKSKVEFLT